MEGYCSVHPTRPALSVCHACDRSFCSDCLDEGDEYYYCRDEACHAELHKEAVRVAGQREQESAKAGIPKRICNFYVDNFVILLLPFPFLQWRWAWVFDHQLLACLAMSGLWFIYYFALERCFQRTVAKFITGTVVLSLDGSKTTSRQIFPRTLSRLIPLDPYLWKDKRCLHDWTSGTRVFNTRSVPMKRAE
jgi:uncharacterized RDD family membrane protein YckC